MKPRIGHTPLGKVDLALLQDFVDEIAPHMSQVLMGDILSSIRRSIDYAARMQAGRPQRGRFRQVAQGGGQANLDTFYTVYRHLLSAAVPQAASAMERIWGDDEDDEYAA